MTHPFSRTQRMFGADGMQRLYDARVAVFGLGGVGGHVVEALARSGIGSLDLIDSDRVALTNLNRQIIATQDTLGQYKAEAAKARVLSINPHARVTALPLFFSAETADSLDFSAYTYVVDAIDTVSGKLALILKARAAGVPVISCMGAGNKLDPTAFEVADITQTTVCPLARVMRRELRKRGVEHVKVVFSREPALTPLPEEDEAQEDAQGRRAVPASNAFVPAVAGLILAGEVVKDIALCRVNRPDANDRSFS